MSRAANIADRMSARPIRSAYVAHNAMRDACATFPRLQSVRLLTVAKRRRDAAREAWARAGVLFIGAAVASMFALAITQL